MCVSAAQVLGLDDGNLVNIPDCASAVRRLQPLALNDFLLLRESCAKEGIALGVASSFRSFDQQLSIWNDKMLGNKPILDDDGKVINISGMSDVEIMWLILRWSALPGTSRHHWGSDLDVYDLNALPEHYKLQLVPEEYSRTGVFSRLGNFFNLCFTSGNYHGFYRPYMSGVSNVGCEPWHISHISTAQACQNVLSIELLAGYLQEVNIVGKGAVLDNLDLIWQRYVVK